MAERDGAGARARDAGAPGTDGRTGRSGRPIAVAPSLRGAGAAVSGAGTVGGTVVLLAALLATLAACGANGGGASGASAGDSTGNAAAVTTGATPAAAPGAATPPGAARPAVARPRVVFLGTSLTAGLGVDPDSAYPAVVGRLAAAAGAPITVVNAGVSGETSAGALRRVDWVLRAAADVVLIETGANDGLRGQSPDSLRANLDRLVERVRARQPGARILLVQMEAPRNLGAGYTARFRAVYPAAARAAGVTLAPFLLDSVAGVPALNQGDGIHPNEAGARRAGATVWRALRPVVDSVRTGVAAGPGRGAGVGSP